MAYLFMETETETKLKVVAINYATEQIEGYSSNAIWVDTIPVPEVQVGKRDVLYLNPQTLELWYEYVDRPLTQTEQIAALTAKIDAILAKLNVEM